MKKNISVFIFFFKHGLDEKALEPWLCTKTGNTLHIGPTLGKDLKLFGRWNQLWWSPMKVLTSRLIGWGSCYNADLFSIWIYLIIKCWVTINVDMVWPIEESIKIYGPIRQWGGKDIRRRRISDLDLNTRVIVGYSCLISL